MVVFSHARAPSFPQNPTTSRNDLLQALRDAGWQEREVSPAASAAKFLEFHQRNGEEHDVAFVYEDEVLFGSDGVGRYPAGYRGFEDAVRLIRAN